MASTLIARNYAQTLFALADRHGGIQAVEEYGRAIDEVAELIRSEPRVREFLETPRLGADAKKRALRQTFGGRVPELFLRYLLVVVDKRRQAVLPQIADAYHDLVDEALNRVRADITVAQQPDAELQREIVGALERRFGKTVVPAFHVEPQLLGGIVVRVGDQILDGSMRHQLQSLRRRLMGAALPHAQAAGA